MAVVSAVVRPLRLIITMTSGKMPKPNPSSTAGTAASVAGSSIRAATPKSMVTLAR
ncbi:hypothetical protein D9M68_1004490 [compost metagenome]